MHFALILELTMPIGIVPLVGIYPGYSTPMGSDIA
jgi:hypothetical protein